MEVLLMETLRIQLRRFLMYAAALTLLSTALFVGQGLVHAPAAHAQPKCSTTIENPSSVPGALPLTQKITYTSVTNCTGLPPSTQAAVAAIGVNIAVKVAPGTPVGLPVPTVLLDTDTPMTDKDGNLSVKLSHEFPLALAQESGTSNTILHLGIITTATPPTATQAVGSATFEST
ncbi:hypothetical protein [Longimycelium tulufanense]|nr:hypothetical protein [Longimycelium tulufanense]